MHVVPDGAGSLGVLLVGGARPRLTHAAQKRGGELTRRPRLEGVDEGQEAGIGDGSSAHALQISRSTAVRQLFFTPPAKNP